MWFLRRFRLPRPEGPAGNTALAAGFIHHLEDALATSPASAELQSALERFHVLSSAEQDRDLVPVYLQLERHIADGTAVTLNQVRAEARRTLATHFAPLLLSPGFALVFAPPAEQERRLCQCLLADALAQATRLLGAAGGDFLRSLTAWIDAVPAARLPVPFDLRSTIPTRDSEWVALFYRLARQLFLYLADKLGENCARSFFERAYDDVTRQYGCLDTFPVVVHLLPERLLDSEKLSRLSQSQIQKVLLQKLGELNDINTRLQTQYEDLDATRRQLVVARDDLERRVDERTHELRMANEQLRNARDEAEAAKAEVQATNLELELRIAERTDQLRSAQRELIKQERLSALGQLTATVAHEFRNPLSAISNTIYTLKETTAGHGLMLERPFARLDRNIVRCEHLIADLLDFTQPRQLRQMRVRLDRWINDVLDAYGTPAGIEVVRLLAASETIVALDRERFRRVLINVLDNAVQAIQGAECAERRITISTVALPIVAIVIEDTGPGIAAEMMPKIFEPLFSTKSFGTGLGLPAAKQIVEQHGGTVSIESKAGAGTRVRIELACASAGLEVA